jgi:hypothetical protein
VSNGHRGKVMNSEGSREIDPLVHLMMKDNYEW